MGNLSPGEIVTLVLGGLLALAGAVATLGTAAEKIAKLIRAAKAPNDEQDRRITKAEKDIVDIKGFKWMIQSTDYVAPEEVIGLFIEPDAIHIMKKSAYSGKYGDYSSFSDELDTLSDVDTAEEF